MVPLPLLGEDLLFATPPALRVLGDLQRPEARRQTIEQMQPAPLRIAQRGMALQDDPDRLHGGEAADHPHHGAQHAIGGAGVAIHRIEGIADEAAVAGLSRQMPGEIGDLPLEAADGGAG